MVDVIDWMCQHWLRTFPIYFGVWIYVLASEYTAPGVNMGLNIKIINKNYSNIQQRDEDAANNGNNIYLNLWPPSYNRHSSDYYKRFYNTMDNQQQQQQQP